MDHPKVTKRALAVRAMRILALSVLALQVGVAGSPRALAQSRPPLPDELLRLIDRLKDVRDPMDEGGEVQPPVQPPDAGAPVNALRAAQDELRSLLQSANRRTARHLRAALQAVEEAWHEFAAGSPDLGHLGRTTKALHKAQVKLKVASRMSSPDQKGRIAALQASLVNLAARMAGDLLRTAEAAGVRPSRLKAASRLFELGELAAERGKHDVAVAHFGGALNLAANTVTFDVALFRQNIVDALAGQTTGHAFSIAYLGQLYQGGDSAGLARTQADSPETPQSPGKEMHVASVSKTLTGIIVQRLLEENGLTPDEPVAPYLPSNWELGNGVDELTFRDFMTHRSGFGQIDAGNSYENLQAAIAMDVGSTSFSYQNANFGLMRVLVAGLMGIDPVDYPEFEPDVITASAFLLYAQQVYNSIGVQVDCAPNDVNPTVQYNFPDDGMTPGYMEPNRQLTCGGFGWFISSHELAAVLTHLRNTENLLSKEARATMQEGFLGYMDPANYGFIDGAFGVYYMHGGDWFHGSGELHACVVAFPIKVEVGLVINSERGAIPYQCALLQTAFDNAWVAN